MPATPAATPISHPTANEQAEKASSQAEVPPIQAFGDTPPAPEGQVEEGWSPFAPCGTDWGVFTEATGFQTLDQINRQRQAEADDQARQAEQFSYTARLSGRMR